jgi:putative ABC transport system permease protein
LDLSIDWRVLCAAILITVFSIASAATMPLVRFTRGSVAAELMAAHSTTSASSQRLRQTLLGVHVAVTIVVLIAAGLFVRAVAYGFSGGPGFDFAQTAYVEVQVVSPWLTAATDDNARIAAITKKTQLLEDGFRSLPGVENVAMGYAPIGVDQANYVLTPTKIDTRTERRDLRVGVLSGSAELLPTLGVEIRRGRALVRTDATIRPTPSVVTASLAEKLWPGLEPIGQTLSFGSRHSSYTVVGIVPDFVYGSLTHPSDGVVVTIKSVGFGMEPPFVIRTRDPDRLVGSILKLVKEVVPDAPRVTVSTGRDTITRDLGRQRLGAWFFSGFGLVALVLGAGGVFGLVAYLAESRRREFGVRLALGATPSGLVWTGVLAGLWPVSLGTTIGLVLASLVARIFISVLPGLSVLDPLTYSSVAILMIGGTAGAGLVAAWPLRRIPASDALRAQ